MLPVEALPMMTDRGVLITLEGGEGAGKSTLLDGLRSWLQGQGIEPLLTREPGGTRLGEAVRQVVLDADLANMCAESELLLMFASRAQLVREVLQPALAAGRLLLCDRFTDASYAYQGAGRGQPGERIAELEAWAALGLKADLTLLLDLPLNVARTRAAGRGKADRIESETDGFFQRVHDSYIERAAVEPGRFKTLDATASPAQVLSQAQAAISPFLRVAGT